MSGKDVEFKNYTLSDINAIELLVSHRWKYDDYLAMREDSAQSFDVADIIPFHEEVIITYVDLDKYIANCGFNKVQLELIRLVELGITHEDITRILNIRKSTVEGRLKTIYRQIKKENDWQWRRYFYTHKLKLKTKACSKCENELPGTVEFYSDYARNKDGFHSACRKCR